MSQPGDQDQSTAAVPAAVPTDPTADPAPGARAWDAVSPASTETYPTTAPAYPAADPYGHQAPSFSSAPQHHGPAAPHPYPGAYHQPGAGSPQPGAPYQPGYSPPGHPYPVRPQFAPEPPMCGLAVASLVCGIVWVYWITSILAIVFAAVAFGKIKREGLRGRGLAVAGLVLGLVWMAFLALGLIAFVVGGTSALIPFSGS